MPSQALFERDFSMEPAIACAVDLAHAARANGGHDFERSNAGALSEGHQTGEGILSARYPARARLSNG
jgi:hypothetical protein